MTKEIAIAVFVGLLIGVMLTGITIYIIAPSKMLKESISKYDFENTVSILEENVLNNGWKITTIHDLKETMKKNGKSEVMNVKVFEICQPDHAHKILLKNDERIVTSLMPCRVSVYEKSDGNVYLSRLNSSLMNLIMRGEVSKIMKDVLNESEIIISSVISK